MSANQSTLRAELEERLRFETLIADLSSKFVNLPSGDVDREIMDAERHLLVGRGEPNAIEAN
jgi:hypothetical protein